jgi:hypothetical protein
MTRCQQFWSTRKKGGVRMAAFAFTLPILPGQEEVVRRIGEAVSG